MQEPIAAKASPRRPWYRLHLSTWLTLPLGLVVAVLVVLPGGDGQYPERSSWLRESAIYGGRAIVHGWPIPFLWRDFDSWQRQRPPSLVAWNFGDSVREFRLLPLVEDSIVGLAAVGLFASVVEWRRRRRRRAIQFTLRELLIFVTAAAICLGWWGHERAVDAETATRFSKVDPLIWLGPVPRLPLWLRACFGDKKLEWLGVSGPPDGIKVRWHRSQQQDIEYIVGQYPHETVVDASGAISDDDAAALAGVERLERLWCGWPTPSPDMARLVGRLQQHPGLREVELNVGSESPFGDTQVVQLATIPRLRSLSIEGDCGRVTERGIAALANCGNLEVLELDGLRLTKEVVESLGEIKQLRRLNLYNGQFINADVSALRRLDSLEELELSGTNLDDSDARQLRSFPALCCLSVVNTQMTQAGVDQLFDPSPGFSARRLEQTAVDADFIDDELTAAFKKLPRLHIIQVDWPDAGSAAHPDDATDYYHRLIERLQQALPDRDIVDGGPLVVS